VDDHDWIRLRPDRKAPNSRQVRFKLRAGPRMRAYVASHIALRFAACPGTPPRSLGTSPSRSSPRSRFVRHLVEFVAQHATHGHVEHGDQQ